MTRWIFLSPHFDGVALSAGGMVWELARAGQPVEIWTVCAGDPPPNESLTEYGAMLHAFWEMVDDVPYRRSLEDAACCLVLRASAYRRYTVPDNIYRYYPDTNDPVVTVPEDNQGPLEPRESYLIPAVADFLRKNILPNCEVVAPLAIGQHRDHVLTRKAAARLDAPVWHYVDFPYVVTAECRVEDLVPDDAGRFSLDISPGGLAAWQDGFVCHRSQIQLLFSDEEEARAAIRRYSETGGGRTPQTPPRSRRARSAGCTLSGRSVRHARSVQIHRARPGAIRRARDRPYTQAEFRERMRAAIDAPKSTGSEIARACD